MMKEGIELKETACGYAKLSLNSIDTKARESAFESCLHYLSSYILGKLLKFSVPPFLHL